MTHGSKQHCIEDSSLANAEQQTSQTSFDEKYETATKSNEEVLGVSNVTVLSCCH